MSASLIFNLAVALAWVFLKGEFNLVNLVWGYILGLGILALFYRLPPGKVFTTKGLNFIKLAIAFLVELFKCNINVLTMLLKGNFKPSSGIVAFPLEVQSDMGITILANMITFTPGSVSLEVTPDREILYVHVLDFDDPEEWIAEIKEALEKPILEVFG